MCPPSVRNFLRSNSDLTRRMENPMSGYVIETRRVETWKFPYTFRFAANNGVPYTSSRSVKLSFFRVFLKIVFSTVRTVSLSILVPKFYGTRRIDLYSRTRFSTVIRESRSIQDESVCFLEAGFPRYYENGLIFKNPKFLDTWRIDSYSRFWYSTLREISLGILDPHYILSGVLGKSNEFSR